MLLPVDVAPNPCCVGNELFVLVGVCVFSGSLLNVKPPELVDGLVVPNPIVPDGLPPIFGLDPTLKLKDELFT